MTIEWKGLLILKQLHFQGLTVTPCTLHLHKLHLQFNILSSPFLHISLLPSPMPSLPFPTFTYPSLPFPTLPHLQLPFPTLPHPSPPVRRLYEGLTFVQNYGVDFSFTNGGGMLFNISTWKPTFVNLCILCMKGTLRHKCRTTFTSQIYSSLAHSYKDFIVIQEHRSSL